MITDNSISLRLRLPDNTKRATRVDQLVTSTGDMQTDIKQYADQMDTKNAQMRPILNQILNQAGYKSIDDLIKASTAQLTQQERDAFQSVSHLPTLFSALLTL